MPSGLIGEWVGTGTVYGSQVKLDRAWSFDLADRFLRGEMGVEMANGASFRARVYWRQAGGLGALLRGRARAS